MERSPGVPVEVLVSSWFLTVLVSLTIAFLWHGFSLKLACALAGENAPGFMRTAVVSWIGGIASVVVGLAWGLTLGAVVSLLVSKLLASAVGLGLGVLAASMVYRRGLKLSGPASIGVAAIHAVLTFAVNMLLGGALYLAL